MTNDHAYKYFIQEKMVGKLNKTKVKIDENPYFNIKEGFREKG
jgi:hypothetical protein